MPLREVGKFPRGQAASRTVYCSDFRGGLNVSASPEALSDTDLTVAYNGYLSLTGGFYSRAGINSLSTQVAAAKMNNGFRFFQQIVNGSPIAYSAYDLCQFGSNLYRGDMHRLGRPLCLGWH